MRKYSTERIDCGSITHGLSPCSNRGVDIWNKDKGGNLMSESFNRSRDKEFGLVCRYHNGWKLKAFVRR